MSLDAQVQGIARMWAKHSLRALPPELPFREPHGAELTSIDSFAAGCITVFLESPTRFVRDRERLEVLRDCVDGIGKHWQGLTEDEKEYFGRLRSIAAEILGWCRRRTH
jgi:hypothetical protein